MRNYLIYNGVSTADFCVEVSGTNTFGSAEPDYEFVSIQGRAGDLFIDHGRYKNVELTYTCLLQKDFDRNFSGLKGKLLKSPGYHRLEDSFHPEEYRMAIISGSIDPSMAVRLREGTFDITFNCKPQRYLKSGEQVITLTASGKIYNPTDFDAKPLIRVYGSGDLGVGDKSVTISTTDAYTDIDCETGEAYMDDASKNRNSNVTIPGHVYPVLAGSEATGITLGTGITKVEITPRWWIL